MEATTEEIPEVYRLKLYITGASPNSAKAVNNIKNIKTPKFTISKTSGDHI